ncbi:MAG: bifunctional diaminohydroxyphosphoribosylaminopyrimidine deaminase/5-amino-6-(5-phosphoribosylamino)uracil reductase RibD [Acidobacteriota bacterium]|nr:bifunctional diaminohydroxyphosphoribosylaminopyrimidine deaminase/5-amino-6-(5-phosphoribosylamino)uracil reductase RibD [Acidobacteriota bacterium]
MTSEASFTAFDEQCMTRALQLAAEACGLASPNPTVGCVLARGADVLAEGAHLYDQRDHAEIAALKQAAARGHSTSGATAYVTLEPCSHHGRTGPCADALLAAGIARCVVATADPNPLVRGRGIARLRAAGVAVQVGLLAEPARRLNDAFAHVMQQRRPFVTLKAALSVDGKLAPNPSRRTGAHPVWITGPVARAYVQTIRHTQDAVLTGIGTVLADDPALTDRSGLPRRRRLLRVVLDSQLRTPLTSQLVRTADRDLLLVHSHSAQQQQRSALTAAGAELLALPMDHDRLSLKALLDELARRDILSLLLEAGAEINGAFLAQGLVDQAMLFFGETELGEDAVPFASGVASPYLLQQSLRRTTNRTLGPDALLIGYLHDPWQALQAEG